LSRRRRVGKPAHPTLRPVAIRLCVLGGRRAPGGGPQGRRQSGQGRDCTAPARKVKPGRLRCKPSSVSRRAGQARRDEGHFSGPAVAGGLCPLGTSGLPAARRPGPGHAPLLGLAPGGVCHAAPLARGAVRSYRTISPLPALEGARPMGTKAPADGPRRSRRN